MNISVKYFEKGDIASQVGPLHAVVKDTRFKRIKARI